MKLIFKLWLLFGFNLILFSCNKNNNEKIIKLLNSEDKTEIIEGCSLLKNKKDTIYVKYLFRNIEDIRISHNAKYYGISVYEARMKTLKRISELAPPNEINYKYDSLNTNFYKGWAIEKGYLKE